MSSFNNVPESERYTNPHIPPKEKTKYDYEELKSSVFSHGEINMNEMPIK